MEFKSYIQNLSLICGFNYYFGDPGSQYTWETYLHKVHIKSAFYRKTYKTDHSKF